MISGENYSWLDRLVHRLAFSSPIAQRYTSEFEDFLFKDRLRGVGCERPIFITSVPRAGTTILLMAINTAPQTASHLYRDMPFVSAPVLWSRFSGRFQRESAPTTRYHDDGIQVGFDSPEAFEEIIWRMFWPERYRQDGIAPWSPADLKPEATDFLRRHFGKIVSLRCEATDGSARYVSKNNANIARLNVLSRMFPRADILVPIRHPLSHAQSLLRQHLRFLKLHEKDRFACRYMRDIGHFEFGKLHRPILFEGFRQLAAGSTPEDLDYWLAYWISAFEHVQRHAKRLHILSYERICRHPLEFGHEICESLDLDPSSAAGIARQFRSGTPVASRPVAVRGELRERAEALHEQILGDL